MTGSRRTGDLIDFDPNTPSVKVTLERSSRGISITVSWSDQDSPYSKWFLNFPNNVDPVPVPHRLLFRDSHGSVLLVGCRPSGFHANMFGPGSGTVWARYAVLGVGADVDFSVARGMETEISGLRDWLGLTSIKADFQVLPDRRVLSVTAESAPAIDVLGDGQLMLEPNWGHYRPAGDDRFIITDIVQCVTRTPNPTQWEDHLKLHTAVRDLLVLSRWRRESCIVTKLEHPDDPFTTQDGITHGDQWRSVVAPEDDRVDPPTDYRPHLIAFHEIGVVGLRKWLALRDELGRALDPVLSTRFLKSVGPTTLLAQIGPGLEALGYLLLLRDGAGKEDAAGTILRERLLRISADVRYSLPDSTVGWEDRTVRAYNSLKHANRTAPAGVDVINAWREGVLVTRAWVATELGVEPSVVRSRLKTDQQSMPYVARSS